MSFDESKINRDDDGKFADKDTPAEEKRLNEFVETDEFRYIKKADNPKAEGHPAYVYAKNDEQAKYLQMTHSKFIKDMAEANIQLTANPNPRDKKTAYIISKSQIANLSELDKVKKDWKLSEIDNDNILIYRDEPFNEKRR